ncbi:MAG: glycosyltransferase family protein [Acidimicrobiia bacterium]
MTAPRFIFYSHDGLGLGHIRRNLNLSFAVAERCPEASVLLACSAEGLESFPVPEGVDLLRLPGLRKLGNDRYVARRLPLQGSEVVRLRAGLLTSAVELFRPDVLLADKHPVGVHGELLPALRILNRQGGRAALGLRDVLDGPEETTHEWTAELSGLVAELHQLILVYGSRELLNPLTPGMLPRGLGSRVRFCGYVMGPPTAADWPTAGFPDRLRRPHVLATTGGGEDGLPLLEAFVEACRQAGWGGMLVAGPQMEASAWARLEAQAVEAGVHAHRALPHLQGWFSQIDALVCMGGYNTLLEAVTSGIPTVCVPRTGPRREQLIRARTFAGRELLHILEPESLSGPRLVEAVQAVLGTPRAVLAARARGVLDLSGAQRAARLLLELAGKARSRDQQPAEVGAA